MDGLPIGLALHRECLLRKKILCTRGKKMRSSTYQSPVRVGHILLKCWTAGTVGDTDRHASACRQCFAILLLLELLSIVNIIACI
jgi:hypothetical protein